MHLAYSTRDTTNEDPPMPLGMGETKGEALAQAAARISMWGDAKVDDCFVTREVELTDSEAAELRKAMAL